jgi:hypothetical protein
LLSLRGLQIRLANLVDPGTICRAFEQKHGELTWDDLELLAAVEDLHKEDQPQDGNNG